ncbi:MAG: hypothetical protein IBJ11_01615 [Phycisphaerales bacterium]|nr:hypothetical protein [Phycisphaerales bacterium]
MATSPETFAQVKNILRKLDRSIDDARTRRTNPAPAPAAPQVQSIAPRPAVQPSQAPAAPLADRPGRAKPLARPMSPGYGPNGNPNGGNPGFRR